MSSLKIEEALNKAKQNPNSEFANLLRSEIESGRMDGAARQQGVDLSRFGRPQAQRSFIQDGIQDIKEIGTGIKESAGRRLDNMDEINKAGSEGQGVFSTLLQKFGQGAGIASDVIGETVIGAGKAVLPQGAEDAISDTFQKGVSKVMDTGAAQSLVSGFQQLQETNPELARNLEASLNTILLGTDLATGGIAGGAVVSTTKGAVKAGAKVAVAGIDNVVAPVAKLGAKGVGEIQGALTGTSQETMQQAFEAAFKGGKEADAFTSALRNNTTPEQLVENVRSSLDIVSSKKTQAYKEGIEKIGANIVDTSNTKGNLTTKLSEFGIRVEEGGTLDFSNSKFRTIPQAQNKLQSLYNEVSAIGDSQTLRDLDTTRQALRELTLTGDDASARSANAIITDAIDNVREAGKAVDGYDELLKDFGADQEFLTELQRSLSTGDKATIDTAYRKLATSLKTNNERRRNLIRELDEVTDGTILSSIAGQQLSELLPRGLFRQIAAGMAGAGIVTGGITTAIIPAMLFASPKVTGEVVRALGLTAKKTKVILDTISSARKTIGVDNLFIPLPSAIEQAANE